MLEAARSTNLALRFGLELALLAVVALAAWRGLHPPVARLVGVVLAPGAVATGWVLLVHGDSVPPPVRLGAQLAALMVGVLAVRQLGLSLRATSALAGLAVANAVLLVAWHQ